MGLISRVSSRTYRKCVHKIMAKKSKNVIKKETKSNVRHTRSASRSTLAPVFDELKEVKKSKKAKTSKSTNLIIDQNEKENQNSEINSNTIVYLQSNIIPENQEIPEVDLVKAEILKTIKTEKLQINDSKISTCIEIPEETVTVSVNNEPTKDKTAKDTIIAANDVQQKRKSKKNKKSKKVNESKEIKQELIQQTIS